MIPDEARITEAQSESLHNALIASCDEFVPPIHLPDEARIAALEAENTRLREALRKYADAYCEGAGECATAIRRLIAERDRLREQIVLAANRLDVCVVNAIADGQHKLSVTYKDWAAEARAALGEGGGDA